MSEVDAQPASELVAVQIGEADCGRVVDRVSRRNEHGMVSAEWAVGLIAAIAVAGVLLAVVTNGAVKQGLLNFILLVIRHFSTGI